MREIVQILSSDTMIIIYESIAVMVFGILDVMLGRTCKKMKQEKEEVRKQLQKEKLQDSLTNDKADLWRI